MSLGEIISRAQGYEKKKNRHKISFAVDAEMLSIMQGIAKGNGVPNAELYRYAFEIGAQAIEAEYAELERKP